MAYQGVDVGLGLVALGAAARLDTARAERDKVVIFLVVFVLHRLLHYLNRFVAHDRTAWHDNFLLLFFLRDLHVVR